MTLVNITVIFVKKSETQTIGTTTVQIALFLHIPNVFLGNHHISSNTYNGQLFGGAYTFFCHPHPLTFIEEIKNLAVIDVIVLVKS